MYILVILVFSTETKKFIDDVFDCLKHKKFIKKLDIEKLSPENSIPKFTEATISMYFNIIH